MTFSILPIGVLAFLTWTDYSGRINFMNLPGVRLPRREPAVGTTPVKASRSDAFDVKREQGNEGLAAGQMAEEKRSDNKF
jgi:hypothetical protein